jgi:hypothetical protein
MSQEIDAVISSAMAGLDGGSDGGDTSDTSGDAGTDVGTDSGDATDVPAEGAADATADAGDATGAEGDDSGQPAEPGPEDTRTADEIAWEAELAELGVAKPKPGQKDNRMPHSRVSKVILNAKKKWQEKLTAEHAIALAERDAKLSAREEREAQFDAAEKLIESDPDRYVGLLAQIYPEQYKRFVKAQDAPAAPQKDVEPQPDVKYDDGTLGYSADQFAKLREYDRKESARAAREESTKEFNERFGPIEKAYKDTQKGHEDVQRVRGHIGKLREQWGAEVIDDPKVQTDIVKYMDDNPKATLVAATKAVVMKRISADRTTMRAEILAELKGAPKAAAKAPVAPNKSDAAAGEQSYEEIIRASMRGIK